MLNSRLQLNFNLDCYLNSLILMKVFFSLCVIDWGVKTIHASQKHISSSPGAHEEICNHDCHG